MPGNQREAVGGQRHLIPAFTILGYSLYSLNPFTKPFLLRLAVTTHRRRHPKGPGRCASRATDMWDLAFWVRAVLRWEYRDPNLRSSIPGHVSRTSGERRHRAWAANQKLKGQSYTPCFPFRYGDLRRRKETHSWELMKPSGGEFKVFWRVKVAGQHGKHLRSLFYSVKAAHDPFLPRHDRLTQGGT